jgi:hypothetical protein
MLFLIQTLGTKLDKTMYLAFEYAHLLIFFLALVSRWAAHAILCCDDSNVAPMYADVI